jgi:hypothetical protein
MGLDGPARFAVPTYMAFWHSVDILFRVVAGFRAFVSSAFSLTDARRPEKVAGMVHIWERCTWASILRWLWRLIGSFKLRENSTHQATFSAFKMYW